MDFKDSIKQISEKIEALKSNLPTEEATKTALVMPFISALGYDVFNPLEVLPEMCCDIGMKKGEKIDYAILKEGEPIMLIECKHWAQDLNLHDNQLIRYFNVSKAKFGVLTNGIIYRFYTDLAEPNKMDEKPFLEVNLLDLKEAQVEELKKFHKSYFDVGSILSSASELKYMGELRSAINREFANPSPDFVKYFGKQVYGGQFTVKITEQFTTLVKRTINSYINDMISDRLKAAIKEEETDEKATPSAPEKDAQEPSSANKIVTTEEELQGFYIVKAILRDIAKMEEIIYRDSLTRFSIFHAKNKSQTICQFQFDGAKKKIRFQKGNGEVDSFTIDSLDNIWDYAERIIESAKSAMQ